MDVQSPPVTRAPVDDAERLAALRRLALLDTPTEEAFDRLTRLAAWSMHAPVALVSLVDEDRQFSALQRREDVRDHRWCNGDRSPAVLLQTGGA